MTCVMANMTASHTCKSASTIAGQCKGVRREEVDLDGEDEGNALAARQLHGDGRQVEGV